MRSVFTLEQSIADSNGCRVALQNDWPEGYQLAASMNFKFPQCVAPNFHTVTPSASNEAIHLMQDMLSWNPKKRPTCSDALRMPYFSWGGKRLGAAGGPTNQQATARQPLRQANQMAPASVAAAEQKQTLDRDMAYLTKQTQLQRKEQVRRTSFFKRCIHAFFVFSGAGDRAPTQRKKWSSQMGCAWNWRCAWWLGFRLQVRNACVSFLSVWTVALKCLHWILPD